MADRTTDLTPKQTHFCRAVASGCTMSDAYREAYSTLRMKPATVNREAHALMANPKITARVEVLQRAKDRAVIASTLSDKERVLRKLRTVMDSDENVTAQLRAAELLGKSVGLFKDVIETQQDTRTPDEIWEELKAKVQAMPEVAALFDKSDKSIN